MMNCLSDDRRIGIAFFYMPAHTRSTMARRSAMLVAGEDNYGYWDRDVEPQMDLDPKSLAFLDSVWGQYRDENATKQMSHTLAEHELDVAGSHCRRKRGNRSRY